jgi:hypothetical protein
MKVVLPMAPFVTSTSQAEATGHNARLLEALMIGLGPLVAGRAVGVDVEDQLIAAGVGKPILTHACHACVLQEESRQRATTAGAQSPGIMAAVQTIEV